MRTGFYAKHNTAASSGFDSEFQSSAVTPDLCMSLCCPEARFPVLPRPSLFPASPAAVPVPILFHCPEIVDGAGRSSSRPLQCMGVCRRDSLGLRSPYRPSSCALCPTIPLPGSDFSFAASSRG